MNMNNTPIMVAPNGARLTQADHPGVPVTIEQTIDCAVACRNEGAHALHAHVRDKQQKHLLDAAAYQALLDLAAIRLGTDFPVQITSEAFGIYTAAQMIQMVKELKPQFASVAMREILRDDSHLASGQVFYQWCLDEGVGVQHILYGETDLQKFQAYQLEGVIPAEHKAVLMVVGRYTDSKIADTNECATVVKQLAASTYNWMLCAFGKTETDCLLQTAAAGGGVRIGFENNQEHSDGKLAANNAERVKELTSALGNNTSQTNDLKTLHQLLGSQ